MAKEYKSGINVKGVIKQTIDQCTTDGSAVIRYDTWKVLSGSGAPTSATVALVGQTYYDSTNSIFYMRVAETGTVATDWKIVGGGGGVGPSEYIESASRDATANTITLNSEGGTDITFNEFTAAERTKLAGVSEGAQVNVLEKIYVGGTEAQPSNKSVYFVAGTGVGFSVSGSNITISADTAFTTVIWNDSTLPTAGSGYTDTLLLVSDTDAWAASTQYAVGDIVHIQTGSGSSATRTFYSCTTAHTSGSTFDSTKWTETSDISYIQYACVENSGSWSWKRIGSTRVDLSNYVQLDHSSGSDQTMQHPLKAAANAQGLSTVAFRNISSGSAPPPSGGTTGDVYLQVGGTAHVGTTTIGSATQPIYLLAGVPTAVNTDAVTRHYSTGAITVTSGLSSYTVSNLDFAPKIVQVYETTTSGGVTTVSEVETDVILGSDYVTLNFTVLTASATWTINIIGW